MSKNRESKQQQSIIVLGSQGMLGSALVYFLRKQGHTVIPYSRHTFDVVNDPVENIDISGVEYVVNAIGLTNRRFSEDDAHFYLINSIFPRILADYCDEHSVRCIHISTDCVFDGKHAPFYEKSTFRADDLYGRSKFLGEPANCMVLRTSIIGPELKNRYNLLSWALSQSGEIRGYRNHLWNGMTTMELGRIIDTILRNSLFSHAVRHVFSGDTTKMELLEMIYEAYDHPGTVIPWDDVESRDTRLRTDFSEDMRRLGIRDLKDQIAEMSTVSTKEGLWKELPELDDISDGTPIKDTE